MATKLRDFREKIDVLLWAFIWLLPFFAYFVSFYRQGSAPALFTFINEEYSFTFIKNVLDKVWSLLFGSTIAISSYLSYLVAVELLHCLFDALVYVPRFAHTLIERSHNLFCKREN